MFNLVGKSIHEVMGSNLYTSKIKLEVVEEYSEQYPEGQIFEQSIEPDQPITLGQEVNVKVSLGSKYKQVPSYYGKTLDSYIQTLEHIGIPYNVVKVEDENRPDGAIASTSISPGNLIDVTAKKLEISVVENP